ncbi:hypothetical protein C8Q69DRAFT_508802 [Paecilomyces variotii]|uniref:Uncharacterized protein n=1 Tax=Byssochlamys spectabilis TaxID=264951 RepID=A0A443HP72_BYSSP|nr:hypothetical protein C8Q69DRAFT_508802 [Paecilomyces variotii]RWQ93574.1 hypothetical protein C8Q69DRAFT_508802 [Paecilomyces variotii]
MSLLAAAGLATNQPPASLDPVAALGLQPITVGLPSPRLPSQALLLAGILGIILGILETGITPKRAQMPRKGRPPQYRTVTA